MRESLRYYIIKSSAVTLFLVLVVVGPGRDGGGGPPPVEVRGGAPPPVQVWLRPAQLLVDQRIYYQSYDLAIVQNCHLISVMLLAILSVVCVILCDLVNFFIRFNFVNQIKNAQTFYYKKVVTDRVHCA